MSRRIIKVGDTTDHDGVVISGDERSLLSGKPIARNGDLVDCPKRYEDGRPHGVNPIIEGSSTYKLRGIPVALEGHRTECGCALIGSGSATARG